MERHEKAVVQRLGGQKTDVVPRKERQQIRSRRDHDHRRPTLVGAQDLIALDILLADKDHFRLLAGDPLPGES